MSIVRSSKFRHVFGKPDKPDACFNGLKAEGNGDTNLAVNLKYFAMIKGSKIFVIPLDKVGRQEENNMPYIDCKAKVLDVQWSPFNDNVLASSEESGDINIWVIPDEGLTETIDDPFWKLHDVHTRKVTNIVWHPTAEYILASSGHDSFVTVWNCETQEAITEIPVGEMPTNMAWNIDGSRLAITTKEDRVITLYIVDPRTGEVIAEKKECHSGSKPTKCVFMKNGNIITLGSDKQANRSIMLWKIEGKTLVEIFEVDAGNASSVQNMYYDYDLGILYTFGKGESVVKYYEVDEDKEVYYLSTYTSTTSQKGGNFMPKRGVNPQITEVARFYKLQANRCEPISFIVPRKSDHFQSDLYPACAGDEPAITADEWRAGKDVPPRIKDFQETSGGGKRESRKGCKPMKPMAKKAPPASSRGDTKSAGAPAPSASSNGVPEGIDFAELLEDMKKVKATVRKLNKRVAKLEELLENQAEQDGEEEEE